MKRLLSLVAFFATLQASAQQVNPVPDYVFRNQMSVGRGTVTDTAAYFSIGPRYGANKGFMPPIVGDTATFSSGKRNGLLIFSVQKNKFLYWDSVRVQWSDMAGSSGTYITGTGITGYVPQFSGTTTIDTSGLFTLGSRLGIGTSSFAYTSATSSIELNGTAGGILGFKRNDSARGYLWHTGDNMELANTVAGAISFNTNSATRGSISSAGVWRLHNLAGTGDRVVVASSNGTLSASTSVTGLVDTTTISTRAWRQKGDDSLGAIIATKGSGTVTSVATGFGLSGGTITTTGTLLVDTLNISTRAWRQKGLDSLAALEVSGSGTTNYVPKFTGASTIGNSIIFDNATNVGIGTASPSARLHVVGSEVRVQNDNALYSFRNAAGTRTAYLQSRADAFDIWNDQAVPTVFGTNNTERLRITSGGALYFKGSSTTTDAQADIENDNTALYLFGSLSGSVNKEIRMYFNGTGSGERFRMFNNGRIYMGATPVDNGYQVDINGTLRSVNGANFATTSGNVGIGTASPSANAKLHIVGSNAIIYTQPSADDGQLNGINMLSLNGVVRAGLTLNTSSGELRLNAGAGYFPTFYSNGTEAMRISTSGELLINTTTDAGDYKLQVAGNIYNTGSAVLAATSGNVGINTSSPSAKLHVVSVGTAGNTLPVNASSIFEQSGNNVVAISGGSADEAGVFFPRSTVAYYGGVYRANDNLILRNNDAERARVNSAGELLINTTTDAGDYKLQVSGNALVTAGKLDITTNTAFGLSVSRSGTSVVGGQINNSNGILYYGAESSTGGGLFTGSSAYAAVIGSGAAYPLQFATNNVVRASINADGEMLIGGADVGLYNLQVTGNAYTQTFQYVGNVLGINTGTYNSAGTAQITMKNGTNPDGSVTDQFILYSADVVAGNAAPHFRTENGGIIKLYQETTAVGAATFTANSGTAVNDASTFDGYTLKQIVKALRNQGILQ